ncbi:putative membrane protein [Lachnoanaerobaculum sp. MSX33]|uniref:hypothetical protein n=1 Tax=Lachnoanaerobaculum sp. MSX33 TaxID=936596 RepID=UPI0003DFB50C|nr:hypothetical protein [Lachnoanaerobaculum sp. MSX33]ETO98963.1 putative membrane protein [Lachnoanaerobaculum sp. MSX33]
MGDRENYNVEEDISISKETVDSENKSMEKYPWLISILYILVLYGWIGFVVYGMKYFNLNKWLSLGFNIVFLIAFITLLTVQISRALPEIRSGNIDYCINGFLFYKYTLLPSTLYFIFLALIIFVGGISVSLVVFFIPVMFLMAPFILMVAFILSPIMLAISFIAALPGFVLAVGTVIISRKQKEMKLGRCVLHILLQFVPVADLIDALYISIHYWSRAKKLAIITAVFAGIFIAASIILYIIC